MDDEDSDEFDLRPPSPDLFAGPLPNFDILEVIGSGGMGKVYKVRQPNLDRVVALKVLSGVALDNEELRFTERFRREATAMARLRHPHIVSLYHYGEAEEGQIYYMMEYVEGADLSDYIRSGKVDPQHLLYWAIQTCDALQFAHENGIVHRDIKPSNLLIDGKGDIKVADFGLAKFSQVDDGDVDTQLTRTNVILGTPNYIAPELLEDPTAVSPSCDLYSIGVTLYQALTGILPRGVPTPPSKAVPGLDPRWDEILFRCLSSSPEERFESAAELKAAFEEMLDQSDLIPNVSQRSSSRAVKVSPGPNKNWSMVSVCAIGAVLAIAGGGYAWKKWQSESRTVEVVPPILEDSRTIPQPVPLRLSGPVLPNDTTTLARLRLGEVAEGEKRLDILPDKEGPVRIWEAPGERGVVGLLEGGSIWSIPESLTASASELSDLVWLSPGVNQLGALRADGQAFLCEKGGELRPVTMEGKVVTIVLNSNDDAFLLQENGEIWWVKAGESESSGLLKDFGEENLAIGTCDELLGSMGRYGVLRVWRSRSGEADAPDLVFERHMGVEISPEDPGNDIYPDRWIPLFPWCAIGPRGEVFAFEGESEVVGSWPDMEAIAPSIFRLSDSPNAGHFFRMGKDWEFVGDWESEQKDMLKTFSKGALQFAMMKDSAIGLFPSGLELADRFTEEEGEEMTPAPAKATIANVPRTWTGDRVELRTLKSDQDEGAVQKLLDAIDGELARIEPLLSKWGAAKLQGKLILVEAGDGAAAEGAILLTTDRLESLLTASREGKLSAGEFTFLPPAGAFRPIADRMNTPDSNDGFFGDSAAHLVDLFRLVTMADSQSREARWKEAKAYLNKRLEAADYRPEAAMRDPESGAKFFLGLFALLHDEYGGGLFLDRLLGGELASLPVPSSPERAVDQFVLAASLAAEKDLLPLFQEAMSWPISPDAVATIEKRFPTARPAEMDLTEFRPAPDGLLDAWERAYESDILPVTVEHRSRLDELRGQYLEALERKIEAYEGDGKRVAAEIFREEQARVQPGYSGPRAFHPTEHKQLDPEGQQAVRDLYGTLGRTYRERLQMIATEATSSARGKLTRALDELFRLQHLFTLEGKDKEAQWAFDRRNREVSIHSLESIYTPKLALDFDLRYEEMIRWAVDEGASVELVQPLTPTQVQHYTIRSFADIQAGRFIWQRLKVLGIQRGAEAKVWGDIHLELVSNFEHLKSLECGCGELRRATLQMLTGLRELESLSLSGMIVDEREVDGFAALGQMELKTLQLRGAKLPREALSILAGGVIAKTVEEIGLANTNTVDILPLAGFRNLTRLDITGCDVPQVNIEEFNRRMRDCLVVR